jgi:dihydrofolate reductase
VSRKVTFGLANSVDNRIARGDHTYDWLVWDEEVAKISADFFRTIDAVIMGRKTYEVALRAGGWPSTPGVRNYVLSRTLKGSSDARVEIVDEDVVAFLRRLKEQTGKGICVMGGGELAGPSCRAGLIDEIASTSSRSSSARGVTVPSMRAQIDLERLECRPLANGAVHILYRVRRSGSKASREKAPTRRAPTKSSPRKRPRSSKGTRTRSSRGTRTRSSRRA